MFVTKAAFSQTRIADYEPLIGADATERLRVAAEPLRGARVLNISATAAGGGVAELMLSMIPLMCDAGLEVDWYVLEADAQFFEVTKSYHNALQGDDAKWSDVAFQKYQRASIANARKIARAWKDYDFVEVHDPQPLLMRSLLGDAGAQWLWRCHLDLTAPNPDVWDYLSLYVADYDRFIFSIPEFVPRDLPRDRVATALPAIDPFRPKNHDIDVAYITKVVKRYGIDAQRPYILQTSRFDPWKDPLGVIEVYRRVKSEMPDVQLVYMAAMADDDPEGWRIYEEAKAAAGDDPDVHLLALSVPASDTDANALEVNAMQRGAGVVLQKSLREGFGLTVTEALWKSKPVVAGDTGGIRYQIEDGTSGFLVSDVESCAARTLQLLNDRELAAELGENGHEAVRSQFLFTRLLGQYLDWFGGRSH